jgi:hypothetical protein
MTTRPAAIEQALKLLMKCIADEFPHSLRRAQEALDLPADPVRELTDDEIRHEWNTWFGTRGFQVTADGARLEFARAAIAADRKLREGGK